MVGGNVRKMVSALIPVYGITLIDVFGLMLMVPLLPYVAAHYGASGAEVGALLATTAVASVVAAPLWGAASDRLGRKPIVLVSQTIAFIGYLLVAWAPSLAMLYVARGVAGIGGGNLGVTQSYIADVTDDAHRDRAYALFGVVFGLGIVLGPVAGGFLVRYGFWAPFAAAAVIELANIGLTFRFLPPTRQRMSRSPLVGSFRIVVSEPRIRSLIVRHFAFIFAVTYFFSIFALYVRATMHLGPDQTSWLMAAMGVTGGLALPLVVGPLTRRFGDARVAQLGLALGALAYLDLPFARSLVPFTFLLIVWAVGASCVEPTLSALLSESAPAQARGAVMGFNDAMSSAALMLAPPLGGWIVDLHGSVVGVVPAVAALVAFGIGVRRRREDAAVEHGSGGLQRRKRTQRA